MNEVHFNLVKEMQGRGIDIFDRYLRGYIFPISAAHLCFDHDLASFPTISGSEIPE